MENMIVSGSVRLTTSPSRPTLTPVRLRAADVFAGELSVRPGLFGPDAHGILAPTVTPHPGLDSART